MNKNKIVSNLYKKMLLHNFSHDEIRSLLFVYDNFNSFNNFIFYLFKLSKENNDQIKNRMCASVSTYLEYLVGTFFINDFDLEFEVNKIYHDIEVNAFKQSTNVLSICDGEFDIYKDAIFVYKKIPINISINVFINNEYKGLFKSVKNINYFIKDVPTIATVLFNEEKVVSYRWQEINNFILSKYWESLSMLKNNLVMLLNRNKINDNNIFDNIYNSTNHFTCINSMINFLMWTNNNKLLNNFFSEYKQKLSSYEFNISLLFDSISLVSTYELALLCNGLNILMGNKINIDYLNNVYILLNELKINEENHLMIEMFDYSDNKYFDNKINQIILNTLKGNSKVYVFLEKKNNMYLYSGEYKVKGIEFNDKKPIFKLTKTIPDFEIKNVLNVSNDYENIFYEKMLNNENYNKYSNQNTKKHISSYDVSIDKMNSLLFKYNWVINKFFNNYDNLISQAFQKFDTKLLINIMNIINKKYMYIFENKLISNWVLASDLYLNHWEINKELTFINNNYSVCEQNELILEVINKKN